MAWKLRKDRLQSEMPQEEADTPDGPAAVPPPHGDAADELVPLTYSHDAVVPSEPIVLTPPETNGAEAPVTEAGGGEPQFAPFDFDASPFRTDPDVLSEPPIQAQDQMTFSPAQEVTEASVDEPNGLGAFAPFQPHEPHPVATPLAGSPPEAIDASASVPPPHVTAEEPRADREEIAPGLILPGTETGVPRVAPFIIDVPPVDDATPNSGTLVLRIGNLSANYPIAKDVTVIGRPDSEIQSYPDLEIELDDAVSRRHAEIRRRENAFFVVDTGSTNGTTLNGEKLDPQKEYSLFHGDRIRIGDRTEIIFE